MAIFYFLLKRILYLIPTLVGVSIISFSLIRLVPGDPILNMLGERGADPKAIEDMRAQFGLDRPLIEQYLSFVGRAIRGDLGNSVVSQRPVLEEFFSRFPATFELGMMGLFWSCLLGIPFGVWAAVKRNSFMDYSLMGASLIGYSMPIFWWGLMLILVFSVWLHWTPVSGQLSVQFEVATHTGIMLIDATLAEGWTGFVDAFKHILLPSIVLGTIPLAVVSRMTRSSMLEVLSEDYIRTARAKGLSEFRVIFIHGLRNALVPVMTVIGLMAGSVVTGAVLTETLFSWPGIGKWIIKSVEARDYPVIQGGLLYIATLVIVINLLVELINLWVNPRLREAALS